MQKVKGYLNEYASYHRHPRNKKLHFIGIPLIMISIVGILDHIVLIDAFGFGAPLTAGLILLAGANLFYIRLHRLLGLSMVFTTMFMYWISMRITLGAHIALFAVGWALQLYGHKIEGKKPAFLKNFAHLFIGPLFIQNELLAIVK